LTTWNEDATGAVLQQWDGSDWQDIKTYTKEQAEQISIVGITNLDYLRFRWDQITNDPGTSYQSDYADVIETCCEGGSGGGLTPDVPDAPTVVKSCVDGEATVSVVMPANATSIEIARDDNEDLVIATL